jgi:hypothetical protein
MTLLGTFACAVSLLAGGLSWVAVWRLRKGVVHGDPVRWPPVLLIRPVESPSQTELDNLRAPLDYPGSIERIVVGPEARALSVPGERLSSEPTCANRKIGHLLAALSRPRSPDTVVVAADADVRVDGALLRSLVRALSRGVGVVMAALEPEEGAGFAHAALRSVLRETHQDFAVVHALAVGAVPLCGKVNAFSAQGATLLAGCADRMSEDLALGGLLHANGLTVALAEVRARMPQPETLSFAQVGERFVRWMQVLRIERPALFPTVPLLIAPAPWLLVALPAAGWGGLGAGLFFLAARVTLARTLGARNPLRWLLGEAVLFGAFCVALLRRRIRWRGRSYPLVRQLPSPIGEARP